MIWNGRFKKKAKRSKDELQAVAEERVKKLEEGADAFEGFEEDEVTGLIDVALERVKCAAEAATERLSNATEELKKQAGELRKIGSDPPARKPA